MYSYFEVLRDYDSLISLMKEAIEDITSYINGTIDYDTFTDEFSPTMFAIITISNDLAKKFGVLFSISKDKTEAWFINASEAVVYAIQAISDLLAYLTLFRENLKCMPEDSRKRFFDAARLYLQGCVDALNSLHIETTKLI